MEENSGFKLRTFEIEDIDKILDIEEQAFPKTGYPKEDFLNFAKNLPEGFVVIENERDIAKENAAGKDIRLLFPHDGNNPDFVDYIVPSALDVPEIQPILVEPIEPNGPYGAKGIGEPALNPTMAAITNAIYNATGIRVKRLPVSPEKILAELKKSGHS